LRMAECLLSSKAVIQTVGNRASRRAANGHKWTFAPKENPAMWVGFHALVRNQSVKFGQ